MAVKTLEKPAITPNAIAEARQRAVRLLAAAYTPQPVAQPDGSTLLLCANGRVARGYERLAAARIARDTKAIEVIGNAVKALEDKAVAAAQTAEAAASTWAAMCAAVGQPCDLNEIYQPTCTCEGCRAQMAWHDHNEARGAYSDALYALLAPNGFDTPPLLAIIAAASEEAQRDRLWGHLKRIRDAADAYIAACKAAGVAPNWRAALLPGEDA